MLQLDSAYKYIAKDWKESLVFCILAVIAMIIPVFGSLLIMGLMIRIISNSINQDDSIPKVFGKIGEDFMNGLKYFAFALILGIPFIALFAGSIPALAMAGMSDDTSAVINVMMNMGSMIIIAIILSIAYALIVPALVANYAKEKRFSAFFEIGKAYKIVFGNFGAYLKMIGINLLYAIAVSAISGILSFTVIVPIVLSTMQILISGKIMGAWYLEASKK